MKQINEMKSFSPVSDCVTVLSEILDIKLRHK